MSLTDTTSFIITNASIAGVDSARAHDVLVREGSIEVCAPCGSIEYPGDIPSFDATGKLLFPSFIDAHVHLRDPGYEYKEDIASGLSAAAHGGFGAVMAMANTKPVNDSASITRAMLEKATLHHPHGPRLLPIGALTLGLEGKELAPMGELKQAGCVAFSNDGRPVTNTEIFRRAMEYAAQWQAVVIDHCEDEFLAKGSHMHEGSVSARIGVKGQPTVAEAVQVARDILLAEYLGIAVHLAHISCKQSVELIRFAKSRGINVTAEVCPHHLLLDDSALENYDTAAKVNPPLRSPSDVAALHEAVADGTFDIFATDHAPHAAHEKEHPLDEAPCGLIGLETAVAQTYEFVRRGLITKKRFIEMWHDAPARIFGLDTNGFKQGDRADFFLFDPEFTWLVCPENLHSKSINTPFLGHELKGKVCSHWLGGHKIV